MTGPVIVALSLLLLVNIAWCVALHRRLSLLDDDGERLREFLRAFDEAVDRAGRAASGLRAEAAAIEKDLRRHAEGARLRGEQLGRLCEGGERLVKRLEAALERAAEARAGLVSGQGRPPRGGDGPAAERASAATAFDTAAGRGDAAAPPSAPGSRPAPELERLLARLR